MTIALTYNSSIFHRTTVCYLTFPPYIPTSTLDTFIGVKISNKTIEADMRADGKITSAAKMSPSAERKRNVDIFGIFQFLL